MIKDALPYAGGVAMIVAAVFAWLSAGRKTSVDESSIVFTQWKVLMDSHKEDMIVLKAEFIAYKVNAQTQSDARNKEIEGLRERLGEVEAKFADFRRESDERIRLLNDENQGLRREIAQIGKSAHDEIVKVAERAAATDHHLGEVEPEAREIAGGFKDRLDKLDRIGGNSDGRNKSLNDDD